MLPNRCIPLKNMKDIFRCEEGNFLLPARHAKNWSSCHFVARDGLGRQARASDILDLVGGLVAIFYFPIYWVSVLIPIDEVIFFRGVAQPPTSLILFSIFIGMTWQFLTPWKPLENFCHPVATRHARSSLGSRSPEIAMYNIPTVCKKIMVQAGLDHLIVHQHPWENPWSLGYPQTVDFPMENLSISSAVGNETLLSEVMAVTLALLYQGAPARRQLPSALGRTGGLGRLGKDFLGLFCNRQRTWDSSHCLWFWAWVLVGSFFSPFGTFLWLPQVRFSRGGDTKVFVQEFGINSSTQRIRHVGTNLFHICCCVPLYLQILYPHAIFLFMNPHFQTSPMNHSSFMKYHIVIFVKSPQHTWFFPGKTVFPSEFRGYRFRDRARMIFQSPDRILVDWPWPHWSYLLL